MSKKRRGYLKHYNDATQGSSMQKAIAEKQYFKIILFWHLLELCNQHDSPKIQVELSTLCISLRVKLDKIQRELSELRSYFDGFTIENREKIVEIICHNYAEYQDLRSTNNQRKRDETAPIKDKRLKIKDKRYKKTNKKEFLFAKEIEDLYREYPRKVGKTKGLEKLNKEITNQDDLANLKKAIKNYGWHVAGAESRFVKHFSTWVSEWRDWVEYKPEAERVVNEEVWQ